MNSVDSLEGLIKILNDAETSNHGKIIKEINIPISEFESYASWEEDGYTRNCIYRSDDYELILLCWDKGASTPIHGHDGQKCWVYQIEGEISEIRYEKFNSGDLFETNRIQLDLGKLTFMNNSMGYHKLSNGNERRAMTLHAYVLPITSCEYYCDDKGDFQTKNLEYDTIEGHSIY